MATYRKISEPSAEPITLAEAKLYLRVDGTDEDALITSFIVGARTLVEDQTWRPLISQQWSMSFDYSEVTTAIMLINKAPLITIDSVQYYDSSNSLQTLSPSKYEYDLYSNPARFKITDMPSMYDRMNTLIITFTCGYSGASTVPQAIKDAMYFIIGHHYENRQDVVVGSQVNEMPQASKYLLEKYRNNFIYAPQQ